MPDESLSDYPAAFQDGTTYPWENDARGTVVPFVTSRHCGKPLVSLSSAELLRVRREAVRRNGESGTYFNALIVAIDTVLQDRMGE